MSVYEVPNLLTVHHWRTKEATAAATAEEVRKPTKAEWTGPRVKRTTAEWEAVRKERRRLSIIEFSLSASKD